MRSNVDVDVVMLVNSADISMYNMTQRALSSLHASEPPTCKFNVVLVETQTQKFMDKWGYSYPEINQVVHVDAPWGYNKALNVGFEHLTGAEYVVIANNDVCFHQGYFYALLYAMARYNLDVASPFAPGWEPHEQMVAQSPHSPLFFGTRTSWEVAGWCVCLRRDALDAIRPFDERFAGEFQDCAMVEDLIRAGYGKMAMVKDSKVDHLLNQSHRLMPDWAGVVNEGRRIYQEKYGK